MQIVLMRLESVFMLQSIVAIPHAKKALRTGFVAF
jgi:hypothetical protein